GGEEVAMELAFREDADGVMRIGIQYGAVRAQYSFFEALGLSFKWMYWIVAEMLGVLGDLIFRGQGVENLGGVVSIVTMAGQAVRSGIETVLRMVALLSVNLGIMNLLPFPALDGGRLVFLGIEKVIGKPLPRKVEGYVNMAGLILLFGFMIFLVVQDIGRIANGGL
ncbi:MAG: site-2 protease family protein, partial [Christensenellaceae bacterium]|nr:site-2 protease family protein [Christensenellaceae bacterium]